jgi:excisionase family DNA binding protein
MGESRERRKSAGEVLTIEELAVYLKIAKSTLYKLAQEGKLPGLEVGRHWRFRREAIDRWLERSLPDVRKERP